MRKKYIVGLLVFLCGILLCFSGVHASEDDVIANDASGIPDQKLDQVILKSVRSDVRTPKLPEEYNRESRHVVGVVICATMNWLRIRKRLTSVMTGRTESGRNVEKETIFAKNQIPSGFFGQLML